MGWEFAIKAVTQGFAGSLQTFSEGGGIDSKGCGNRFTGFVFVIETAHRLARRFRQAAETIVE